MAKPGKIRIIAGQWRGRKLDVLDSPGLRPTPDRLRETLFNWLQNSIAGSRSLDLFAGSGALSFEMLSRGASHATLIESEPKLVTSLNLQAEILKSSNHLIIQTDAMNWLRQASAGFDIIFLDPPFGKNLIEDCCQIILERSLLNTNGLVYIESEKGLALPDGWQIKKEAKAGNVQCMLIEPA